MGRRFADELLGLGTILGMNASEAMALAGEAEVGAAARRLHGVTRQPVVVTLGKEGTLCHSAAGELLVPTRPVKPVDTIGAGDAHTAGFLSALAQGKTLREACAAANDTAAIVVQHTGCSME